MSIAHKSRIWFNNEPREELEIAVYPGGEVRVGRLPQTVTTVNAQISDAEGIQALFQVADILRRRNTEKYADYDAMELPSLGAVLPLPELQLRYMPYARQDRVAKKAYNEAHALGIFARQLNSMNWPKVVIWDPHSDVTPALVHNSIVVPREELIRPTMNHLRQVYKEDLALVVPDQGAYKATMAIAEEYGIETVCTGEKLRDMKTGQITGSYVHNVQHLKGKVVLIADDICDGGRTFIGLAEFITRKDVKVKSKALYVTHGIFSKGIGELMSHFDIVACPNLFFAGGDDDGLQDKLRRLRVANLHAKITAGTVFYSNI